MYNKISAILIASLIWFFTSLFLPIGFSIYCIAFKNFDFIISILVFPAALFCSLPILVLLIFICSWVSKQQISASHKLLKLIKLYLILTLPYGIIGGFVFSNSYQQNYLTEYIQYAFSTWLALFICSCMATFITQKKLYTYFLKNQTSHFMEQNQFNEEEKSTTNFKQLTTHNGMEKHNKVLVKGVITALLILAMLIPTVFVSNLVSEREGRQKDVVEEVTNGWSLPQTLSGPYIYIPYQIKEKDEKGKVIIVTKNLYLLPENLSVTGTIMPEVRSRSIYKILLYRSDIKTFGNFKIKLPKDIELTSLQLSEAKLCYNISDFKGIEQKVKISFNGMIYELSPGLPTKQVETILIDKENKNADYNTVEKATKSFEVIGLSTNIT